jgi:Aerotolerance regulator N-terminal
MTFVHQALMGAMLLTLLPLLIHIINLVRHQRVEWAAMEFLLASYKKHRRWVWLKQFLLMLTRMAIVALLVMMCAQWVTHDQWLAIFGGKVIHHYVLLDDSYSMSQQTGGASAYAQATQFISQLAQEAAQQDTEHQLTVLRCSQVRTISAESTGSAALQVSKLADFHAEPINAELLRRFEQAQQKWHTTEFADAPTRGIAMLRELFDPASHESRVLYLLSDFRRKDWQAPTLLRDELHELQKMKCELHLIDCARPEDANLSVIALTTESDTKAAGVPLFVQVQVKNQGTAAVRRVQLKLRSLYFPPAANAQPNSAEPQREELPLVLIETMQPGEVITRRVQVYFPQAGHHVVEAELPSDAVASDNVRRLVVDLPDGEKTLVIDGSVEQQHAYFMSAAFRPLERSNTGIVAEVKPASFLRDSTLETLRGYSAIYLCDVPRLENRILENLKQYVQAGGGVAFFLGDNVDRGYYNKQLYEEGRGLFPAQLELPTSLPAQEDSSTPDFTVSDHPVFSFFRGERNSFLAGVTIARYVPLRWTSESTSAQGVQTVAELRNKQPLFVEKHFGEGRVIACATTVAPLWNDWAKNPSFVVVILKLHAYLAAAQGRETSLLVGDSIHMEWESNRFFPEFTLFAPDVATHVPVETKMSAAPLSPGSPIWKAVIQNTAHSGFVEAWRTSLQGAQEVQRFAVNVDAREGDLAVVNSAELLPALQPVKAQWHRVDQVGYLAANQSGYNRSILVMTVLIVLMLAEQALAYAASYHSQPLRGGAK